MFTKALQISSWITSASNSVVIIPFWLTRVIPHDGDYCLIIWKNGEVINWPEAAWRQWSSPLHLHYSQLRLSDAVCMEQITGSLWRSLCRRWPERKQWIPDILDEARWGLEWLLKMNPDSEWCQPGSRRSWSQRLSTAYTWSGYLWPGPLQACILCHRQPQGLALYKTEPKVYHQQAGKLSSAFCPWSKNVWKLWPGSCPDIKRESIWRIWIWPDRHRNNTDSLQYITIFLWGR